MNTSVDQQPSLESLGTRLGEVASNHLEHLLRRLLKAGHESAHFGSGFIRVVTGEMHPLGNFVIGLGSDDFETLEEAVSPLATLEAPAAVIFASDTVSDRMAERLQGFGFENHGAMPAMAVDTARLAETTLPAGYRFEEIAPDRSEEWANALAVGYDLPVPVARLFSVSKDFSGDVRAFAAIFDGRMHAVSVRLLHEGVAGIYGVATLEEARGKGLGAHVTAEPLRLAAAEGYRTGVLQASDMGYSVYQKLGFEDVGKMPLFVRMPDHVSP